MSWSEKMATGFTLSTLFCLVLVIMDHQWIKVETEMQIYYSGLWKVCLKLVCPDLVAAAPNVNGAKTLLIMALFCGFIGSSFMSITYRYSTTSATYRYLVPAVASFISAALVFLGLSIYTIRISTHGISRTSAASYQWPFYLAWTTCPFFILSAFLWNSLTNFNETWYTVDLPSGNKHFGGFLGLVAHQHVLMHGTVLSDKESKESDTSSVWSSSSSSSPFWEEGEKEAQILRA